MAILIKKHQTLPFLNAGTADAPDWVQIKKATEFTHSLNPETEERDYIADEQPTTELMQYKPSMSLSVTTLEGEADFDLFYELYKNKAVGEEAKREYMIVYLFDKATAGGKTYYKAIKTDATITVDEFNSVDSTITVSIYENGTPTHGFVTIEDGVPVFTEGDMPEDEGETAEETETEATVTVQEAYGAYEISQSIKDAVQADYLSKLKSDYGLDYDGEMQSFTLTLAAGQKAAAELKFACGAGEAHWPTDAALSLSGTYTFAAGKGQGKVSALEWDFENLVHEAAFTGEHNEAADGHESGETEHYKGEAATIKEADAQAAKALAKEVAEKWLSAPLTYAGGKLTNSAGEEIASK